MLNTIANLDPKIVWNIFHEITQHPRPSKHEDKIIEYVENFAKLRNLELKKDNLGNIVIKKPATPGMENRKSFCIQAHLDMVCEKNRDVEFDFFNDPIQTWIDGDWVKAKGTTLGADNGIGLAMGLAVLADENLKHPDYEMLCTLDEETGLTGALQLGTDLLTADILINLDSEEDGHFTIGCAGGLNTNAIYSYEKQDVPANSTALEIIIKGLKGGHSGIEINDGRANSIVLLTRLLWNLDRKFNIKLNSFNSGNKHNAIPREGFAVITVDNSKVEELKSYVANAADTLKAVWGSKEANIQAFVSDATMPQYVMSDKMQFNLLNSFFAMPHGVIRMSADIQGLVETSMNFAIVETTDSEVKVLTSQRSSVESEKQFISEKVQAIYKLAGAEIKLSDGYPAWQPNINSPILQTAVQIYENKYGEKPVIEAIHAGLECGLIGEKYPNMDMISFGPTLKEVHTPDEKVQISTVAKCWDLLVAIIENLPAKA